MLVGTSVYRIMHRILQVQEYEKYQFMKEVHQSGDNEYVQEEELTTILQ